MKNNVVINFDHVTKKFIIRNDVLFSINSWKSFLKGNNQKVITAIDNVTFKVREGEAVGFWGNNGSGKTTILKLIAGLYKPDRGKITVSKSVASVLELGAGLHPELTGRENIYFYSSVLKIPKEKIKTNYQEIIDFFGFPEYQDIPIKKYSSGMKSRLAFSIVVFSDANILLLDEALSTGDMDFTQKAHEKIKSLKETKTIIFTSHNYSAMQQICDRMISMKNGKVINASNSPAINFLRSLNYGTEIRVEALSNSMEPTIFKGDSLDIKKIKFNRLHVDDIVAFSFPNIDQIIVHRIIAKQKLNNKVKLYTKGDHSSETDPWELLESNYIGKVMIVRKISH